MEAIFTCTRNRFDDLNLFNRPAAGHDRGMLNVSRALTFVPTTGRTLVARGVRRPADQITLRAGRVHRLDSHAHQPAVITAVRGTLWLTLTPGDDDIILRAGEQLAISDGWPVVIQAITDAAVTVG